MLLGTLGASMLGNKLTGKVILDHIIWIIWINIFSSAPSFKQYSDNISRIKDGAYVINIDDKQSKRTHWASLFINRNNALNFDSFGIGYIPEEG